MVEAARESNKLQSSSKWIELLSSIEEQKREVEKRKAKGSTWKEVLRLVVSPGTNGNDKPRDQPWKAFCEGCLGQEIVDCPTHFESSDVPFETIILMISKLLESMHNELEYFEKKLNALLERKKKLENREKKKEANAIGKVNKIVELREAGKWEDVQEEKRQGMAWKKQAGRFHVWWDVLQVRVCDCVLCV